MRLDISIISVVVTRGFAEY
jgi:hypothetical protein